MKGSTIAFALLSRISLSPDSCFGFVRGSSFHAAHNHLQKKNIDATHHKHGDPFYRPVDYTQKIRGGAELAPKAAALSDYSDAAKALFGNMVGPAAMIAGGLVPLGFLAGPLWAAGEDRDQKWKKKAQRLYMALSVLSLVNELLAIMYATVATNKLTEIPSAPTSSVFALLRRDYELPWVATNVHFIMGLLGFCTMIMLRALCIYPAALNTSAAGMAFSALIMMISIVNAGVGKGDGQGQTFGHGGGGNILWLGVRYLSLLFQSITTEKYPLRLASIVCFAYFGIKTIQNLVSAEAAA